MDSVPPAHGPARPLDHPDALDQVLAGLGDGALDEPGVPTDDEEPAADLPEVVEAVSGRARDLHRLADRLSVDEGDETLSAVALLRAHAGAVGDLAEHLQAAGGEHGTADPAAAAPADPGTPAAPATTGADATRPDDADPAPDGAGGSRAHGSRGGPRHVG
ncbi:hypothetical protein [Actinomycetospora aeridis]|uniref:Uncharacterized protein n=1 Tax=Actinomycetospora aeridis TaxID=3129231 RepID=A0ABU8N996_9PSEU